MVVDEDSQEAYCDGILGNYNNKSWQEDRLFCTAFWAGSLIGFWTIRDAEKGSVWVENTPSEVKKIATYGGNYVARMVMEDDTSLIGCLYGYLYSTVDDYPYRFPANVHEYLNKTQIEPHDTDLAQVDLVNLSWNVQGYIEDEDYQDMVDNQLWFQNKVPTEFRGWNNVENSNTFLFVHAKAITLSASALLLSQLEVLPSE